MKLQVFGYKVRIASGCSTTSLCVYTSK